VLEAQVIEVRSAQKHPSRRFIFYVLRREIMEDMLAKASDYRRDAGRLIIEHKFAEALPEVEKAEAILNGLGDSRKVLELKVKCCQYKSNIYLHLGKEIERRKVNEEVVEIMSSLDYPDDMAKRNDYYASLSLSLSNLGEYERAMEYAEKVLESCRDDEGFDAGMRIYTVSHAYMHDRDRYHEKIKDILILSRGKLLDSLNELTFPKLLDIQHTIADIAFEYDNDALKAHKEMQWLWKRAKVLGLENCELYDLLEAAVAGNRYCFGMWELNALWIRRALWIYGKFIDRGNAIYDHIKYYVEHNINMFLINMDLDKSVTVERVLKWLEYTEQQTQDKQENAKAQWLAGITLIVMGKGSADERRGVRFVKTSIRVLKRKKDEINLGAVAIGDEYIARYLFQKGEYDLAEHWYRIAIKDLALNHPYFAAPNRKRISDGLAECLKHK
jgi:tetratricopeptide (TPR) repeat protein